MSIYASLLKLYPRQHRGVFAEEMTQVFREAEAEVQARNLAGRTSFYMREFAGLICGAVRERFCKQREEFSDEQLEERSMKKTDECRRFPGFVIVMMTILFVLLIELIAKGEGLSRYTAAVQMSGHWDLGKSVRFWPTYWRMVSFIVTLFVTAWLGGITAWMVAYALRKTAAQRLGEFQAWPLRAD